MFKFVLSRCWTQYLSSLNSLRLLAAQLCRTCPGPCEWQSRLHQPPASPSFGEYQSNVHSGQLVHPPCSSAVNSAPVVNYGVWKKLNICKTPAAQLCGKLLWGSIEIFATELPSRSIEDTRGLVWTLPGEARIMVQENPKELQSCENPHQNRLKQK